MARALLAGVSVVCALAYGGYELNKIGVAVTPVEVAQAKQAKHNVVPLLGGLGVDKTRLHEVLSGESSASTTTTAPKTIILPHGVLPQPAAGDIQRAINVLGGSSMLCPPAEEPQYYVTFEYKPPAGDTAQKPQADQVCIDGGSAQSVTGPKGSAVDVELILNQASATPQIPADMATTFGKLTAACASASTMLTNYAESVLRGQGLENVGVVNHFGTTESLACDDDHAVYGFTPTFSPSVLSP